MFSIFGHIFVIVFLIVNRTDCYSIILLDEEGKEINSFDNKQIIEMRGTVSFI